MPSWWCLAHPRKVIWRPVYCWTAVKETSTVVELLVVVEMGIFADAEPWLAMDRGENQETGWDGGSRAVKLMPGPLLRCLEDFHCDQPSFLSGLPLQTVSWSIQMLLELLHRIECRITLVKAEHKLSSHSCYILPEQTYGGPLQGTRVLEKILVATHAHSAFSRTIIQTCTVSICNLTFGKEWAHFRFWLN